MSKNYTLLDLDNKIRSNGVQHFFTSYSLSSLSDSLSMTYLDEHLDTRYIFIFRSSRLAWRVYDRHILHTFRTCQETFKFLQNLTAKLAQNNEYYSVITLKEYTALINPMYNEKLEIYRRFTSRPKYPKSTPK
ncbi:MAG: hypothetical protein LBP26_06395 [Clostridiales bacterium]|jgi:hypothetical protein|nr:hypothetical protein [Clostridiales bacterium]